MTITGVQSAAQGTRSARRGGVVAWVLQVLLAVAMVAAGLTKLVGEATMVEMFDDIGLGQWLRYAVGVLEVAGGVGLLVPRLRALAAVGLLLLLVGATITNLTVLGANPAMPIGYAVVAAAILWLRRHELPTPRRAG